MTDTGNNGVEEFGLKGEYKTQFDNSEFGGFSEPTVLTGRLAMPPTSGWWAGCVWHGSVAHSGWS